MNQVRYCVGLALLVFSLSSCSWFTSDNQQQAAPVPKIKPALAIEEVWSTGASSGTNGSYLQLPPTVAGNVLYTVDNHGLIVALDKHTGKKLWRIGTKTNITTGAAVSPDRLAVGTGYAQVLSYRPQDGKLVWFDVVSNEILAKPVIVNNYLLIKVSDGHLIAFDATNGRRIWTYERSAPSLVLRGSSSPSVSGDKIIVGFDDGKVVALSLQSGRLLWEQQIASAEGGTVVEQMVDIDTSPLIVDGKVYVASYQGNIAALGLGDGHIEWQHPFSSYTSISYYNDNLFATDANGYIYAFSRNNGGVLWKQTSLQARGVTGPVVMGNTIVVGDSDGYLHWLDQTDGHFIAQTRVAHSAIFATPVVSEDTLYVVTAGGDVAAYRIKQFTRS